MREGQVIDRNGNVSGEPRRSRIASFWMEGPAAAYQAWAQLVYKLLTAEQEYEATGREETLRAVINTDWGLPYLPRASMEQRKSELLEQRAGFVAVFNSDEASWHLVEDHRGKTVYDVASGDALFISELGPLPENVTWLSPGGEYQKWNGTAWVKDTEAEKLFRIREAEETKNSLMQVASEHIAPLQDAVDLEIATEEEISLLEAWKKYRVLLNRVNTTTAPDIEWPVAPIG
ncbi:terminase gpA endonuclease subunit [Escherichia coli]|uniref:tail fiber assembly protein n=1 Tax=Escherichia coli TaxID=562 RepID=UPI003F4D47A3